MPYSLNDPPDRIRDLPKHGQEIWIAAFNNAIKQRPGDEEYANRVAWAAVKTKYKKEGGQWVAKTNKENRKMTMQLVEMMVSPVSISVVEENGEKTHIARFHVSRGDEINGNNRIYPLSIWQNEARKITEGKKVVLGQSGHPDGTPNLLEQFLYFRSAHVEGNDFYADAKVIMTSKGKDFVEIVKSGIPLPVSTRGRGSVKTEERNGVTVSVVQEDYDLQGIDVLVPGTQSFKDATLVHFESLDPEQAQEQTQPDMETEPEPVPADLSALSEADREELRKAAEARAKKYGIGVKEGGHLTPPAGYPTDPDDYGDGVNYRYPLVPESRARNAVVRFNDSTNKDAGGYTDEEWAIIGKRIAAANPGKVYRNGKIVDKTEEELALEKRVADLQAEVESLLPIKEELEKVKNELAEANESYEKLKEERDSLSQSLSDMTTQLSAVTAERDAAKAKAQSIHEELEKALNHLSAHAKLIEMVQGKKFALPLITKLQAVPTAEEVEARLAQEEQALMSQLEQQAPPGKAKFQAGASEKLEPVTEDVELARTRRLQEASGIFLS